MTQTLKSTLDVFREDLFVGKVLFCTGGGSGIGYGQVRAMMRHGADAVIVGRRADVLAKAADTLSKETGRRCIGVSADVRKPESLKVAVDKAVETFGGIDYVINAAAGNFLSPIESLSPNGFKTVIEIDLLGTFNAIRATMPHVLERRGAYVHVSATLFYTALPLQAHASAAKAGVDALSRVLGVELGPRGVRSNVIAPGPIADTEGASRLMLEGEDSIKRIPVGRMGCVEDIAAATVFLFSPAGAFINSEQLVVDGGAWHIGSLGMMQYPDVFQSKL